MTRIREEEDWSAILSEILWLWNLGLGSFNVIGYDTIWQSDRPHTSSYSPSIVNNVSILYRYWDIQRQILVTLMVVKYVPVADCKWKLSSNSRAIRRSVWDRWRLSDVTRSSITTAFISHACCISDMLSVPVTTTSAAAIISPLALGHVSRSHCLLQCDAENFPASSSSLEFSRCKIPHSGAAG